MCAVLMAMLYALLQHLFEQDDQTYLPDPNLARESLALASARHHIWDWSPSLNRIDTSPELALAMGYRTDIFADGGQHTFIAQLHPDDVPELIDKAGAITAGATRSLEQDIRLKDAEGRYRWFALRARVTRYAETDETHCIGTLTDISKAKTLEARLQTDAVHDPVTGLPAALSFLIVCNGAWPIVQVRQFE